ncbi:TPA: hypothetical protein ACG3JU_000357 [Clostridioides difficile]
MITNSKKKSIKFLGLEIKLLPHKDNVKWVNPINKNQKETPYTDKGLELYWNRQKKKKLIDRLDEVNTSDHAIRLRMSSTDYTTSSILLIDLMSITEIDSNVKFVEV